MTPEIGEFFVLDLFTEAVPGPQCVFPVACNRRQRWETIKYASNERFRLKQVKQRHNKEWSSGLCTSSFI